MNTLTVPRKLTGKYDLLMVEKVSFERLTKENAELRMAVKAVVAGELALRGGRTQSFSAFLKDKFPHYAKDK